MQSELEQFITAWEHEAKGTVALLRALPADQYDFRPDREGRSLGELAWHLAELDCYTSFGIEQGGFTMDARPPGLERPRTVAELAPGFERVHRESIARFRKLGAVDFDQAIPFFGARMLCVREILWSAMLMHTVHHRGQLTLMCRLAGGTPPGLYGPNREEMAKIREEMKARG